MRGMVFDIARFSLNDGPGIRTTVFLKGCPLRCQWCHNPESANVRSEIFWSPRRCINCGRCVAACRENCHTIRQDVHRFNRRRCTGCGDCAAVCVSGALELVGKKLDSGEVLDIIRRDRNYYGQEGGVTLSGGEPLFQPEFSRELLAAAHHECFNTAIETSGFAPWSSIEPLLPITDLWLFDLKCADSGRHRELTGVSNELILENLHRLDDAGARIELRFPLVPGRNDSNQDLEALRKIAMGIRNLVAMRSEPYHPFGLDKSQRLGRSAHRYKIPDQEDLQRYHRFLDYNWEKHTGDINHQV